VLFFSKDLIIEKFIEVSVEMRFIVILLLFLRIRIYYSYKLFNLREVIFSFSIMEKSYMGIWRIIIMSFVIVFVINLYLRLVFRLNLEFLSYKLRIYLLIVLFFFLSIFTNLNYKIFSYDKMKNFIEIWYINFYSFDKFVYWRFFTSMEFVGKLFDVKLILLINW